MKFPLKISLEEARLKKGFITQSSLAKKLGVDRCEICSIEKHGKGGELMTRRIASALGIEWEDLVKHEDVK